MDPLKIAGFLLRILLIAAVIWGAIELANVIKAELNIRIMPHSEATAFWMMLVILVIYALLLSLPFVPGAEIGVGLMAAFGPTVAPLVYVATVAGLSLAFLIGALVPPTATCRFLRSMGLSRAADLVTQTAASPDAFAEALQRPSLAWLARHKYLALMVLLNIPGNAIIGGGGGISFMSGLSCAFKPIVFLVVIAIAVAPVPLAIFAFGLNI